MITAHVCSWLELTGRCLGAIQADRSSFWRWVEPSQKPQIGDFHSQTGLLFHVPPHLPTAPSFSEVRPSSSSAPVAPTAHSFPHKLARSHFSPCVWLGPRCSPGFTLLGDGPVAVAVVVRWPVCVGRQRVTEAGTEKTGEWAEPGGILLFYYAGWSACRLMEA